MAHPAAATAYRPRSRAIEISLLTARRWSAQPDLHGSHCALPTGADVQHVDESGHDPQPAAARGGQVGVDLELNPAGTVQPEFALPFVHR